jgi:hypothetical protein
MKGLVATTAVLGVLAIGGLPALALTLAAEETGPDADPTTTLVEDTGTAGRPGPPPWAQGRGPGEERGPDEDEGSEADDGGTPGWARGEDDGPPPGWARNHAGATPHGWAVREWASCLADGAAENEPGDRVDPETDCGPKPVPPGEAKKGPGVTGQPPGQQDRTEPPGQAAKPEKTKKAKPGRPG